MNNYKMFLLFLVLSAMSINAFANEDESASRVNKGNYPQIYSNSLHDEMSIAERYQEGGIYYLRGTVNSFGEQEAVNTQQEVVFCTGGDETFTDIAKASLSSTQFADHDGLVVKDSASTGALPSQFISALENGLKGNSKGRFCYKQNNPDVEYRTAGAEVANYCAKGTSTGVFLDEFTGNRCELILDIDLKAGESRYLRQPDGDYRTISQGFVNCSNDGLTQPELSLVSNPESCGVGGGGLCSYSCIWADDKACSGSILPRWGGGSCGGIGSTIFVDDSLNVKSSSALSFNVISGTLYEGSAQMSCESVNGSAVWVITDSNCTESEE